MVVNFDTPTEGKSATLPHGDVETFFHEFGHVMHNICSESKYSRLSGTSVERDFVELPSQMLENWVWDKEVLQRLSKHQETGEPLPEELINKKLELKNLNEALATLKQLFLATFDFVVHSEPEESQDVYRYGLIHAARKAIKHKNTTDIDTSALWSWLKPKMTFVDQV